MHKRHTVTAVVTGKPIEMGGSLGRREATGRGCMIVTREALARLGMSLKGARVAIQGFGNVGSVTADLLAKEGAVIVAVSDKSGGLHNAKGLDVGDVLRPRTSSPARTLPTSRRRSSAKARTAQQPLLPTRSSRRKAFSSSPTSWRTRVG